MSKKKRVNYYERLGVCMMIKKKKEWALNYALFSALRRVFMRSPYSSDAFNKVKRTATKGKQKRVFFTCASCGVEAIRKDVCVDHVAPVVDPKVGFVDWITYIARLFCGPDNLQILCKKCHKIKTLQENKERRGKKNGLSQARRWYRPHTSKSSGRFVTRIR